MQNPITTGFKNAFDELLKALQVEISAYYRERLVALAIFGSVGRGTMRPDSDMDLLIVAEPLPKGRLPRVAEFAAVEAQVDPLIRDMRARGVNTYLSPLFKTPAEISARSPILLDMTEDARILFDRQGFLQGELDRLRQRLLELGAKRHFRGNAWWWDLKPDFKPGDVVVL